MRQIERGNILNWCLDSFRLPFRFISCNFSCSLSKMRTNYKLVRFAPRFFFFFFFNYAANATLFRLLIIYFLGELLSYSMKNSN